MADDKALLIMQHAQSLFIEYGFHGTSMQMIAKATGIAAGTVYLHFPGKNELIRDIYRHAVTAITHIILKDHDENEPPFEQYHRFWTNARHGLTENLQRIQFKEMYERSPFFDAEDQAWGDEQWKTIDTFYQSGVDTGLFRQMPNCLLGYLSLGSVLSISHTQRIKPFEMTQELEEELIRASWTAILADH